MSSMVSVIRLDAQRVQASTFLIKSVQIAQSVEEIADIVEVARALAGHEVRRDFYPGIYVHALTRAYELDAECETTADLEMAWSEAADLAGWHLTKKFLKLKLLDFEAKRAMGELETALADALA